MKVALFGGTGFVGSYIIRELIRQDFMPRVLVRWESASKITSECEVVFGDIQDENAILETLKGVNAVIYNIGIIRQFPKKDQTFIKLHYDGVNHCIKLAQNSAIKRFILMSANGVKPDGTEYQKTKWQADEALKASELNWTIFRPSLIFGNPGGNGRPEFCSKLRDDMFSLPLPAPLFYKGLLPSNAGSFSMTPIHVENVAEFFVKAINRENTTGRVYELGGPETFKWSDIIHRIALASGKQTWKMPVPINVVQGFAKLLECFKWFPVTSDQLIMLMEGNSVRTQYFDDFSITPRKFSKDNLEYLR